MCYDNGQPRGQGKPFVVRLLPHTESLSQVWALAVSRDEKTIVSGAADSVITFWEDSTEKKETEKEGQRVELASKFVSVVNPFAARR